MPYEVILSWEKSAGGAETIRVSWSIMSGGKNGSPWGQRGSQGTFGLKSCSSLKDFRKGMSYMQWKPLVVYLFVFSKWSDLIIFVFLKKVILAAEWKMDWKLEGQDRRGPRELNQRAISSAAKR